MLGPGVESWNGAVGQPGSAWASLALEDRIQGWPDEMERFLPLFQLSLGQATSADSKLLFQSFQKPGVPRAPVRDTTGQLRLPPPST